VNVSKPCALTILEMASTSCNSNTPSNATSAPVIMDKRRQVELSKFLSHLLRHSAHKQGLAISSDGFAAIADILALDRSKRRNFTKDEIIFSVHHCAKQRFALKEINDTLFIRANQGHSMPDIDVEMRRLTLENCASILTLDARGALAVHGSYMGNWPKIVASGGLSRMTRQHIHLAKGLAGDAGVVTGMRANCNLLIYVDVARALSAGIAFFESQNGAILTPGLGDSGILPLRYVSRAVNLKSGKDIDLAQINAHISHSNEEATENTKEEMPQIDNLDPY